MREMAAEEMVMPLSLSGGRKSITVLPLSTSAGNEEEEEEEGEEGV